MISSPEMRTWETKGLRIPNAHAVRVVDEVDAVAVQRGNDQSMKPQPWSRKQGSMKNHWKTRRMTMVSARAWPRHAAARNVVRPLNDRRRIAEVRIETGPIAAIARPEPKKTQPAVPSSVLGGIAMKAPIAPLESSEVREMQWTVPPDGTKVAEISRIANPPVGGEKKKSDPRVQIAEDAMTGAAGMTAPRGANRPDGIAMQGKSSRGVELLPGPNAMTVMNFRRVETLPNEVATATRPDHRVRMLRVQTEATAMTGLRDVIAMIVPFAVTTHLVRIVARRSARRETLRVARN
jgi:hypothetical protein